MSAGLPGLGLGGLFFIFSALLAPLPELWKTLRGRSDAAAWRLVGRQFAQAVTMIVAIDLTIRLVYLGLSATGLGDAPRADTGTVLPLTLIGITSVLLVAVIGMAKLAELGFRIRTPELPRAPAAPSLPAPLRTLVAGGIVTLAWFALLAGGASELSPLVKPREDRTAEQRVNRAHGSPSSPVRRPGRQLAAAPSAAPLLHSSAARSQKPVVDAGDEEKGNDVAGAALPLPEDGNDAKPTLQPSVQAAPPATPGPPERPPATAPAAAPVPAAEPASSPPGVAQPGDTGPPVDPGPPEGSPAPGNGGPPPHARSQNGHGTTE
ncbi:MAG TPA: hypothetical protein VIY71_05590 [Solirubrobacterales bacterium]